MNKHELLAVLNRLGVRPSRKLGQNFLIDPNMLDALIRDAEPAPGQNILEVGPGTGALTRRLLAAGCRVTAVELDARLHEYLESELGAAPRLTLVRGDACILDYDALFGDRPYRCIANLPYSCSSVFLARIIDAANPPMDLHLLLQREMARRLAAKPGTGTYGALSVRVQLRYEVAIVRRVPPQVFFPVPEVESACLRLRRREPGLSARRLRQIDALTRLAFRQRRKKLIRVLAAAVPARELERAFQILELDENSRPEELDPAKFAALAACLDAPEAPYCHEGSDSKNGR